MLKPRSLARKLAGRTRLTVLAAFVVVLAVAVPVFAAMNDFTSNNNGGTAVTTVVVNKPAGLQEGDVMIASVSYWGLASVSVTSPGWQQIAKRTHTQPNPDLTLVSFWKEATASDVSATSFTFTLSTAAQAFGGIARYDDVVVSGSPATPVAGGNAAAATNPTTDNNPGADTNLVANSVTTTQPGQYVTAIYALTDAATTISSGPSGMSPLYNQARTTGTNPSRLVAYDVSQAATGASGTKTAVASGSIRWIAHTIPLKTKPKKLGVSTPARSGVANDCLGPITVETRNTAGGATNPLTSTDVNVSSDGTGTFHSAAGCGSAAITQGTVQTNQTSVDFYYKPTDRGDGLHTITATASGLTQTTQDVTVKQPQTITFAGPTSPQVYGNTVDIGPATSDSTLPVTVTPSGGCSALTGSNTTITSATTDCTLTASQAGDATYAPAQNVVRVIQTDPRPIEVTADSGQSKVYSNSAATDPTFTYHISSGSLVGTDSFTGSLTRAAGETVAGSPYAINQGTLALSNNYTLTFVSAGFNITKKPLSVNAQNKSKTYGSADPALTAQLAGFVSSQNAGNTGITGQESCSRAPGETVAGSPYTITCTPGTLDAPNYSFTTGTTATLTINRKALTVGANPASKTYGELDPTFSSSGLSGFVNGEDATTAGVTGSPVCSRVGSQEGAGAYPNAVSCAQGTLAADNYSFTTGTATFTINKKQLTVDADPGTKVYGDLDPAFTASLNGFVNGEDATSASVTGLAACNRAGTQQNVGSYDDVLSCTAGTLTAANYSFTPGGTNDFTVTKRTLTVDADPASKTYGDDDPPFAATLNNFAFGENRSTGGVTGVEDCDRAGAGTDEDAGTYTDAIACTVNTLDATNYSFVAGDAADFTINEKQLVINADPDSKTYGATDPTFTGTLSGFVNGEDDSVVTGTASCSRSNPLVEDVATYNDVISCAQGSLDATNYSFATGSLADFTINKKQLDIDAVANSKTYGDSDPSFTGTLSGFEFTEDETSANVTGQANCTRTGTDQDVDTYTGVITCAQGTLDAANYSFATGDAADFTIDPRELTVDANPASKTYGQSDPTFTATLNGFAFGQNRATGGVTGDEDCDRTGTDEGAGTYNDVLSCTAGTLLADNYYFTAGDTADFTINAKTVSASYTVQDKTYDRTTDATVTGSDLDETDLESGDVVTLVEGTATFATASAGTSKATVPSGFDLAGADEANYTLSLDPEVADIDQKSVDGSFTAADKEYDGTTAASASNRQVDAADVISPDVVTLTGGTATFDNKNVGDDKTVTLSGATLGGADGANYELSGPVTDLANITAKQLTGVFTADNKVYDGDNTATGTRSLNGVIGTEDVILTGGTATFDDKNVGNNKTVTLAGASLGDDGNDSNDEANYTLASGAITDLANITAKGLTVSGAAAQSKVYDGTPAASVDVTGASLTGAEPTDTVSIAPSGHSASFNNKNRGNGKPVNATIALTGGDAGNYTVTPPALTANITPKTVTGGFNAASKIYNGSSAATVTSRSLSGVVGSDDVSLSGGTAAFASPNAGNNKTVTLTGAVLDPTGADVSNYTLAAGAITDTANITKKSVTGSFTAADKDFDGTTAATITGRSLSGVLGGDDVSLVGGTAAFGNANPGVDKFVSGSGFSLGGSDAGNYALSSVDTTTATIRQRDPGQQEEEPPTEEEIEQGASDKLGGDVKPLGTDFGGMAFGFAPEDQGKKLESTNQPLFALGCTADCDVAAKKTVLLTTGDGGASAAATKKLKLKTQNLSLVEGELGVVKLKLTKKQKKAIKKANKAKLVIKTTVVSEDGTVADKKTYRLKT